MIIFNQYKDTLNDFIDNLDPKSLDLAGLIDKRFRNILKSKKNLINLLERNYFYKDLLDRLL